QRKAGEAVVDHEGLQMLTLGGKIDAVIEIAGHHVGAAADYGLERFRATLEVDDLDIDAGLFVFAERMGEHRRQITEAEAAADRKRHLRLCKRKATRQNERRQSHAETSQN